MPEDNYWPEAWRSGSTGHNKQGSGEAIPDRTAERVNEMYSRAVEQSRASHDTIAGFHVAPELARLTQLTSQYTELVWKIDLRNLMNFLRQRTDSHAQWEIRQYAQVIEQIAQELFPHAMAAWDNHVRSAVTFSRDELAVLGALMLPTLKTEARQNATSSRAVLDERLAHSGLRSSRQDELREKVFRVFASLPD